MKRSLPIICLVSVLLLATAVPAFASPDGNSGTVYGKAVLAPYALVISGGGADPGSPLTYEGDLGQGVGEKFGSEVTVQNSGSQPSEIKIDQDQPPTAGEDTWNLTSYREDEHSSGWVFIGPNQQDASYVMPSSSPNYERFSVMNLSLAPGGSSTFSSMFFYPMVSGSAADHYMSAIISAVAPIN